MIKYPYYIIDKNINLNSIFKVYKWWFPKNLNLNGI